MKLSISTAFFATVTTAKSHSNHISHHLASSSAFLPTIGVPSSLTPSTKRNMSSPTPSQAITCPTISLRDGTPHPAIGFGTYKVGFIPASASSAVASTAKEEPQRTAAECVSDALACGYRFLECAEFYGNESEVGKAIKSSGIARNDLFLCSKVWTTTIEKGEEAIRARLDQTLSELGTDYVDLYLIHWPVPGKHVHLTKHWKNYRRRGRSVTSVYQIMPWRTTKNLSMLESQ